jgi:hypothetical protein
MDELAVEIAMAIRVVVGPTAIELKETSPVSNLLKNPNGARPIWNATILLNLCAMKNCGSGKCTHLLTST